MMEKFLSYIFLEVSKHFFFGRRSKQQNNNEIFTDHDYQTSQQEILFQ